MPICLKNILKTLAILKVLLKLQIVTKNILIQQNENISELPVIREFQEELDTLFK